VAEIDTEVKRWGNSLGVRLPRNVLKAEGIREGDHVHIRVEKAAGPNTGFWGLGKRFPIKNPISYEKFKAEEKRLERARDRRVGRAR